MSVARALKAETIVGLVPREMPRTFWNFIMHGESVGCEITGRRTLVRCEITRKRTLRKGGGADKQGGAHSRYQFFRCGKVGGGTLTVLYGMCVWMYCTSSLKLLSILILMHSKVSHQKWN